jgi:TldD protein
MSATLMSTAPAAATAATDYLETRRHTLRKMRMLMLDGNLTANLRTTEGGISARVHYGGYWGFAAVPDVGSSSTTSGADTTAQVVRQARSNAQAMGRFGARSTLSLAGGSHVGEHRFVGQAELSAADCVERLQSLNSYCKQRYPSLRSTRFMLTDEHHTKWLQTSRGGDSLSSIQRAMCYVTFMANAEDGSPIELNQPISWKGSAADYDLSPNHLAAELDALYQHLQAKRSAVPAKGGNQTVVLAPALAGMLAHEAMGHPCEGDIVLGGAITGGLLGQSVASPLVSMVDVAHTWRGQEVMMPVYVDDEGTPAQDALLIDKGRLSGFMHSRETAERLGQTPTGSARAYAPGDEPLVRMRNTVILPGTSKLDDMVAGVDNGYLLMKTGNGQADSTTEFMFGVTLAYEIKNGKVGPAIRDTTVSGSAIKVLQSVDAVSDDMHWEAAGYCGKKQPMVVSMGGPALRAQAHLGGQ